MSFDLTGQKVSFTYQNLLQYIDGSYYNGLGDEVFIQDNSSLTNILASYISDASLSNDFYWFNGLLYVDVSAAGGGVSQIYVDGSLAARDASLDYLFNWNDLQDVSIQVNTDNIILLDNYNAIQDASIAAGGGGDPSVPYLYEWNVIQDVSIQTNIDEISQLDSSIVRLDAYNLIQDASIAAGGGADPSVPYLYTWNAIQDVSIQTNADDIVRIDAYDAIQDASIAAFDASVGGITEYDKIQDVSITDIYSQIGDISVGYDPSTDYVTNQPISGDISINYTGELVTSIVTNNWVGIKTADFIYDINEDVSVIYLNNYGEATRTITFEKDLDDNIIAVHIEG